MAFIESIENLPLAGDSFDQIFLSPIMLSLIVRKGEGWGGERGESGGVGRMCCSNSTVNQPLIVTALILRLPRILAP